MNESELLQRFRPWLIMHPEEEYFPSSVEYFLDPRSPSDIGEEPIVLPEEKRRGERNGAPVYGVVTDAGDYWLLQYIVFYPYNGAIGFAESGAHQADWEHISMHVSKGGEVTDIYLAAHRERDGRWHKREDLDWVDERPVVYVAKGSHAHYNAPRTYVRIFGVANDKTGRGERLDPPLVEINEGTPWVAYEGYWGINEIRGPRWRDWWRSENGGSTNGWKRFFWFC